MKNLRMHFTGCLCCLALGVLLFSCLPSMSLRFDEPPDSGETTVVALQIPEEQYRELTGRTRAKFALENPIMSINNHPVKVEDIHLRGSSSMLFRRKSLSVALKEPFRFSGGKNMENFFLVSMSMDRSYFENVFAFRCLELLNISRLYYQYAEVWINDRPEGVYLIVQRPNDYAIDELGSPYVVRRGAFDQIDDDKRGDQTSKAEADLYRGAYEQIALMAKERRGEDLYQAWQKVFDVESYFRLLAFFYWVRNGDYADELYFYLSPEKDQPRFHILPWDFDDIFAVGPHEGMEKKISWIGDKMLFSGEAELDRIIALDPFLYKSYLHTLKQVLEKVEKEDLQKIFQDIYKALYPYYGKPEVIGMSKHDQSGQTDLERLREDLTQAYRQMLERREETLRKLKNIGD